MSHSPEQMRKKNEARAESEMHAGRNVVGEESEYHKSKKFQDAFRNTPENLALYQGDEK